MDNGMMSAEDVAATVCVSLNLLVVPLFMNIYTSRNGYYSIGLQVVKSIEHIQKHAGACRRERSRRRFWLKRRLTWIYYPV